MAVTFYQFIRGAEDPVFEETYPTLAEAVNMAESWASAVSEVEKMRVEAYILDEEGHIIWTFPKDLIEATFDTEVVNTGNSVSIIISKQAQMMGLHKGDLVNVTLRRIR